MEKMNQKAFFSFGITSGLLGIKANTVQLGDFHQITYQYILGRGKASFICFARL